MADKDDKDKRAKYRGEIQQVIRFLDTTSMHCEQMFCDYAVQNVNLEQKLTGSCVDDVRQW
jgi:hypothetical protein